MAMIQTGNTPNAAVARIPTNRAGNTFRMNDALTKLSMLVQLRVLNFATGAPPVDPEEGDAYVVTDAATGAWALGEHNIVFASNGWNAIVPLDGWRARFLELDTDYRFDADAPLWTEDYDIGDVAVDNTADSAALARVLTHVSTVAIADDDKILPSARPGRVRIVVNDGANSMNVAPDGAGEIDELGVGNPRAVPAGKRCIFFGLDDERWSSFLSA